MYIAMYVLGYIVHFRKPEKFHVNSEIVCEVFVFLSAKTLIDKASTDFFKPVVRFSKKKKKEEKKKR